MKSVFRLSLNCGTGKIYGVGFRSNNLPYGGTRGLSFSFANSRTQGVRILGSPFSNTAILSSNFATEKDGAKSKKKRTPKQIEKDKEKKQNEIEKRKAAQAKEREKNQLLKEKEKEKEKIKKEKEKLKTQNANKLHSESLQKEKAKKAAAKIKKREVELQTKEKDKKKRERERAKAIIAKATELRQAKLHQAKEKRANRVKKALSAFTFYIKENHHSVKKQHPNESAPEILKRLAANWKLATPEQKKSCMELAAKDKIRSATERSKIPKRPATGYALFVKERYASEKGKGKNLSFEEVGKLLSQEWRNMGAAQKQKYMLGQTKK